MHAPIATLHSVNTRL